MLREFRYSDIGRALWIAWKASLPEFSLPPWFEYGSCCDEYTEDGDMAVDRGEVLAARRLLSPLCVTVMDKCNQCLLIQ